MDDLFSSSDDFERVRIDGADVRYLRNLGLRENPGDLLSELIAQTPWRQEEVRVWGKTFPQPRLIAWYGEPGTSYSYSGISLDPMPWTETLLSIRRRVEERVGLRFNSVLLNYYRDGSDSMGLHSDDEPELGLRPVIASVTLGAERTLIFKSKVYPAQKPIRLRLGSGSLLLMQGETQRFYKHGIAKETRPVGPRVNLTFRRVGAAWYDANEAS